VKRCCCCGEPIPDRLYEYGEINTPSCFACHHAEMDTVVDVVFQCEPIFGPDGRRIGHRSVLTEYGVVFFDGKGVTGDVCAITYY
jgi:hypothetical protein